VISPRALIATLMAAILGVVGLDATTILAAPNRPNAGMPTQVIPHPLRAPGSGQALRVLQWAGHSWLVYPVDQQGPESVPLSNSPKAVYVDSQGRLHLRITKVGGIWRSVELQSLDPVSYGTFHMTIDTKTALFDPWAVLGMFVYRPGSAMQTNEIDIEDSRFPHLLKAPDNAQFVVQPYYAPHHLHGYPLTSSDQHLYQQFTWLPGTPGNGIASFETHVGTSRNGPLLAKWSYQGYSVPTAIGMHLYINLWMNKNHPVTAGTHSAIITGYDYVPAY
jgi:hypothetical protein